MQKDELHSEGKNSLSGEGRCVILVGGEMSEWSNVPLSKSGRVQALVGSNPTLSAPTWRSLIVV